MLVVKLGHTKYMTRFQQQCMSAHAVYIAMQKLCCCHLSLSCVSLQASCCKKARCKPETGADMQTDKANTGADGPLPGRATALAGVYSHAGNHQGVPCALGPS